MSDEDMLACFANATVCVFAADYAEVMSISLFFLLLLLGLVVVVVAAVLGEEGEH